MKTEFPPFTLHWYDGMMLMPHHFRYAHSRSDSLVHFLTSHYQPYYWGLTDFEYNKGILGDGIVEVTKLEAILPDGSCIQFDGFRGDNSSLTIDLRPHFEQLRQKPCFVYVAIARSSEEELQSGYRRYEMLDQRITTYGEKGQEAQENIVLTPKLHLLFTDVLPARLVGIQLLEVAWENEGLVVTPYVPPCLHIHPRSEIGELVHHIIQRKREKAQYLVSRINNPQAGMSELVIDEYKFFVSCLCENLPHLEALLYSKSAHPFSVFLALVQSAGRMASLGTERIPPQFKPYNHDDIYASYDQLRKYILKMIAEGVVETFVRIPFRNEGGVFKVEMKPQWKSSEFIVSAHPRIGVAPQDLNSWVTSSVIGSDSILPTLKSRRVLGVDRNEIERLPDVIVSKGTLLYTLAPDDDSVIFGEDLCVENTLRERTDFAPVEMSLYVKVRS